MIPYIRRRAALKGPLGGSRGWTLLWSLLIGARILRRLTRAKEEVLLIDRIGPGEALLITGVDRDPKIIGGG
jgi:hypothetical protein